MSIFCSTRDKSIVSSSAQAIAAGLAPDGGLYTPVSLPRLDPVSFVGLDYRQSARRVLGAVFDEFAPEDIAACVVGAYTGTFDDDQIVPIRPCALGYMMELWHGPTCAFKDLALTALPRLLTFSRRMLHQTDISAILTATSGDTGKAALSGFADVEGTDVTVFYPRVGVSRIQEMQMRTSPGENVEVVAVNGTFDDCQRMVKAACSDERVLERLDGVTITSANSINIGRLAPQIVYYFTSYARLLGRGAIRPGDSVDFVVPTGNFGDILAGYMAGEMGLPVGKLICASNENDVLTDFIHSGVYDRRRPFRATISPSMDILVSSNLERLLYMLSGDDELVAGYMRDLSEKGHYEVTPSLRAAMGGRFAAYSATEADCRREIARTWREEGILIDPHTAVAAYAARRYKAEMASTAPLVILSTASPYKFAGTALECLTGARPEDEFACLDALEALTGVPAPGPLKALRSLPVRFDRSIDPGEGIAFIADKMARLSRARAGA